MCVCKMGGPRSVLAGKVVALVKHSTEMHRASLCVTGTLEHCWFVSCAYTCVYATHARVGACIQHIASSHTTVLVHITTYGIQYRLPTTCNLDHSPVGIHIHASGLEGLRYADEKRLDDFAFFLGGTDSCNFIEPLDLVPQRRQLKVSSQTCVFGLIRA